jgi:hypothetical protein
MSANDPDWLDPILRRPGAHLDDDGFTQRVMSRLPPPRNGRARAAILLGAAVAAGLVGGAVLPAEALARAVSDLLIWPSFPLSGPLNLAGPLAAVALAGSLIWGAFASAAE